MVLRGMDDHLHLNGMKPGMKGTIYSISHRYRGTPNEHFEFWVVCAAGRGRYGINQIIKYGAAERLLGL